ncbi:benzoate/H(+) symporter BenE family transporter [Glutamicibacter sp. MNS18]|uniref:benzoate/H(+) symporter BenE family transporter n=1 Tax=Glutamicibacter sp. MNS18 TaxID=2989817 RepID=UPI00223590C0|nr:benzoate/H(+) symporter BenE family transporter [Glutamicibacter sp. MNS18]MCW4464509.1 benzoate/H(+) symporter BenE family transporter [Glutamicibacter sp. MNS18]
MPKQWSARRESLFSAVLAGFITTLVGFTSSFAVVLTGLSNVGATASQAASGLLALSVLTGLSSIVLSLRHRIPVSIAWSTPGAAMLASMGAVNFGFNHAVGAFLVGAGLIVLSSLLPFMQRLLAGIPVPIAQGMLAGVLIPLCLKPFSALGSIPLPAVVILLVFLATLRLLPRYAVALTMLAAVLVGVWHISTTDTWHLVSTIPSLQWVVPEFSVAAIASISLPLFIVTMASQNIPGVAVMSSFNYQVPWRSSMLVTGTGSALGSVFGGHAINLAAITAAIPAGDQAGPDRSLRWRASASSGVFYLGFAAASALIASVASASPAGLFEAAAGLALVATLGNSLAGAVQEPGWRLSSLVTVLFAAGNVTIWGIGGAFWALVAGLATHWIVERRSTVR